MKLKQRQLWKLEIPQSDLTDLYITPDNSYFNETALRLVEPLMGARKH